MCPVLPMRCLQTMLNPTMSFLSFVVLPTNIVCDELNSGAILSIMASQIAPLVGGQWLVYFVTVDAIMILCATVLTSFIGVTGLLNNMARDGLLPEAFLRRNVMFDSFHWIIGFFWAICCGLVLITWANMQIVSNVCKSRYDVLRHFS